MSVTPLGAGLADGTGGPAVLLELAVEVATEAGRLLLAGSTGQVTVLRTKSSPTDVVTAVDVAAEQLVRDRVLTARPDDAVLGEEGDDIAGRSGITWVVDPIDGTVNYLYGLRHSAVALAAVDLDGAVVGVVHNPWSGETYTAVRGGGAFCNGTAVTPSRCVVPAEALVGVGYHYRADIRGPQAVEVARLVPRVRDVRRLGSAALDLCYVATGRLDAYVERGLKPWDLAAAGLVAQEAGVRVEGLAGAPPGELLVVAAPEPLFDAFHDELIAAGYATWPVPGWP